MSILDRKPKKYSTSDLFWVPSPAPIDGAVGDVNTQKLDPSHLGMAQDMIIDTNGVLRSRGAIQAYSTDAFTGFALTGIAQIPQDAAASRGTIATVRDNSPNNFLYGTSAQALTGFAKLTVSGNRAGTNDNSYYNTAQLSPSFARMPNDRGLVIMSGSMNTGTNGFTNWGIPLLWGGNAVTTSDTATGTAASTVGSKAIVGVGTAWTSALNGCYLFINTILVGQIDTVGSTTTATLVKGAYATVAAAAPAFKTARMPQYTVYKGRITTNTASNAVVGAGTKFLNSDPGTTQTWFTGWSGAVKIFRYSDGALVGTVTSVQNDTTLTLTGNAAIAMANEEYYAIAYATGAVTASTLLATEPVSQFSAPCVEVYADRYWYGGIAANSVGKTVSAQYNNSPTAAFAGGNVIAFSKKGDPECLDLDPVAGDFLRLPTGASADTVRGLCATRGGMVIFRLNDAFLLTGYSPETFRIIKLVDDGMFFNCSFKPYKDGVIWSGKKSVWYFDGTRVVDLLQGKVKRFYRRASVTFSTITYGNGIGISQDHVLLSTWMAGINWPYKNTTGKFLNYVTWAINMNNGAVSFFTNLFVLNSMIHNDGTSILVGYDSSNSKLLNGDKIINDSPNGADNFDAVTGMATFSSGAQIGPDWMFESVRLSNGNAARMKFWKMLLMNYASDITATINVISLNDIIYDFPTLLQGTVPTTVFPVSSASSLLKRVKFLARCPSLIIRVYPTNTTSAVSQRFKLFWYAVGGKWMRWGRAQ